MRECRQTDLVSIPEAEGSHPADKTQFISSLIGDNDPHTIASGSQLHSSHSAGASPPVPLLCSRVRMVNPPERRIQGQHNRQLRFALIPDESLNEDARPRLRREPTPWNSPQEEVSDEDIFYLPPQVAEEQYDEQLDWYAPIWQTLRLLGRMLRISGRTSWKRATL